MTDDRDGGEDARRTRRRLLSTLGTAGLVGLAGCSGLSLGGSGTDREPFGVSATVSDPDTTETAGGDRLPAASARVAAGSRVFPPFARRTVREEIGGRRRLVLVGDPLSETPRGTTFGAGFLDPPAVGGPAKLRLALQNDANRGRALSFGRTPPFSAPRAVLAGPVVRRDRTTTPRYLLVPSEESPYGDLVPQAPTDGHWYATDGLDVPATGRGYDVRLGPGESVVRDYFLLRHPDAPPTDREAVAFDADASATALGLGAFTPNQTGEEFIARSVPDFPVGKTSFFRGGLGPVFVRPSQPRLTLPRAELSLELVNNSLQSVAADQQLRLYRLVDGEWFRVLPWELQILLRLPLPPGATQTTRLRVDSAVESEPLPSTTGPGSVVLGPGLYGIAYGSRPAGRPFPTTPLVVRRDGARPPPTETPTEAATTETATTGDGGDARTPSDTTTATADDGERVALGTLVRVIGNRPPLVPTADVASVSRDGDTVTVVVRPEDTPTNEGETPRLEVTRGDLDGPTIRVILEQVYRFPALRNALAYLGSDRQRVRVLTSERRVRRPIERLLQVGEYIYDGTPGPLVFTYDGDSFVARAVLS